MGAGRKRRADKQMLFGVCGDVTACTVYISSRVKAVFVGREGQINRCCVGRCYSVCSVYQ